MARAGGIVSFDFQVDHWVRGAMRFRGDMQRRTYLRWLDRLDQMFEQTQRDVHVVTGSLRASGKREMVFLPNGEVEASIEYGGLLVRAAAPGPGKDDVEYAWFEMARGGSHDFMTPAMVAHMDRFTRGQCESFEEVVRGWR